MYFHSLKDFLAQGTHGFFVWLAYGVTFVTLIGLIILLWQQERRLLSYLKKRHARQQRQAQRNKEVSGNESSS
ncbi:heme exporter protein CcmD [Gallaecimonas pentaromativorans]|uniref:Heme exporter protein D n=1 Tax=Gallaecimonas pentaromativorans TaxID=584787 RepID=A0A3N1P271_9GAMM|nr:heme exporter protein CcmD [Gallaecimonas pentaromativorans]ROQ22555.1 heme exporter protein D [Gallaecimonas pentaromativorans]